MSDLIEVVAAIIVSKEQVLVSKRKQSCVHAGKLEFPGGKVEPGEAYEEALRRECFEELGIELLTFKPFHQQKVHFNHRTLHLHFYWVDAFKNEPNGREGQALLWLPGNALKDRDFLATNTIVVGKIEQFFFS